MCVLVCVCVCFPCHEAAHGCTTPTVIMSWKKSAVGPHAPLQITASIFGNTAARAALPERWRQCPRSTAGVDKVTFVALWSSGAMTHPPSDGGTLDSWSVTSTAPTERYRRRSYVVVTWRHCQHDVLPQTPMEHQGWRHFAL